MMSGVDVDKNLRTVLGNLPEGVSLVAISKFHPATEIKTAYAAGQRVFGESHEQEIAVKVAELPKDIEWHFIGHLQTNKVRFIAPYISMVESGDSEHLLKEISKQALKVGRVIDVLLELHIAEEETKYGFSPDACREYLSSGRWRELKGVRLRGLMMMASNVADEVRIASEFDLAAGIFDDVKTRFFADDDNFNVRSWGMSHDYKIAVSHGSSMVRVGTAIFGPREY
jgi:pyridoxal phosphate enzyme (YggS family)